MGGGAPPPPPPPPPPPQMARAPDAIAVRNSGVANQQIKGAGGGQSGASGTFLTGPGGVDPNSLTLGKKTLLGA